MSWAAAIAAAGQIAGASIEQNSKNSAAKRAQNTQFLQNLWLQQRQIEWEKERATHAHQWEMQDLKDANLNPALTATGGQGAATGSISAPSSAMADTQGLQIGNLVQQLVEMRNNTKATNASANLQDAQALKTLTENKYIPKNYKLEMMNAISNRISANANQTNAITNREVGKAQAKYTNERSRGYTKSTSESRTKSGGASILGSGGNASSSYSKSSTYTY